VTRAVRPTVACASPGPSNDDAASDSGPGCTVSGSHGCGVTEVGLGAQGGGMGSGRVDSGTDTEWLVDQ
jgi:hypothetical protein